MAGLADSRAADIARAEGLAGQALTASPRSWLSHAARGEVLRAQTRCAEAIAEHETVLALNRNSTGSLFAIGLCKLFTGSIEETIPLMEQAIRLSPRDPNIGVLYLQIGRVHLLESRTEEAIVWLEKARSANAAHPLIREHLAAAYGLKGESERAAAELAEARKLSGNPKAYSSIAGMRAGRNFMAPNVRALYEATFDVGLRKAGVPEE
jgi:adenylate cyclase